MKLKNMLVATVLCALFPFMVYASDSSTTNKQTQTTEQKPLYWIDTMEPDIHYDAPGKSRMGMELVPVYPKEKQSNTDLSEGMTK